MKIIMIQNRALFGEETSKQKNFDKIIKLIAPFKGKETDIIILPELFSTGWYPPIYPQSYETEDHSDTLIFLNQLAKEFNSNVIGGSFVLKTNNELKNTCPILNRNGEIIAKYEKMHLFSHYEQGEGKYSTAGNEGIIVKTDVGKIGISICYDIRFPELHRAYTYNGAELLINVAAWPKTRLHHYQALARARAIENQIFFIGVTQTGLIKDNEYNSGYSLAVNPFGDIISSLTDKEEAIRFEINLNEENALRKKVPTLNDRKEKYNIKIAGV